MFVELIGFRLLSLVCSNRSNININTNSNISSSTRKGKAKRKKNVLKNIRLHSKFEMFRSKRMQKSSLYHGFECQEACQEYIYIYFVIYKRWNVLPSQIKKFALQKRISVIFLNTFFTFSEKRWISLFRLFPLALVIFISQLPPLVTSLPEFDLTCMLALYENIFPCFSNQFHSLEFEMRSHWF